MAVPQQAARRYYNHRHVIATDTVPPPLPLPSCYPAPAGLIYYPVPIYQAIDDSFNIGAWDVDDYLPDEGIIRYVDIATGDDGNDGLVWDRALKSLHAALAMSASRVLIAAGLYPYGQGWDGITLKNSCSIVGVGGQVILSKHLDAPTWTQLGAPNTHVWWAACGTPYADGVSDAHNPTAHGDYSPLTERTSIATVEAAAGSWWQDNTNVYVRLVDDREPDGDVRVWRGETGYGGYFTSGTLVMENIEFHGGGRPFYAGHHTQAYAKNCKFMYGTYANGFASVGATTYLQDCTAAMNWLDGFNYHAQVGGAGVIAQFFESGCIGRDNGLVALTDANNGSTSHDGSHGVRVNCEYMRCQGPVVHDVTLLTQTWNLACSAHDSAGVATNYSWAVGPGEIWLDACLSAGSTTDLQVNADATAYLHDCGGGWVTGGAGTITAY